MAAKRIATSAPSAAQLVFDDDASLTEILAWTGRRTYIVVASVCRNWRKVYRSTRARVIYTAEITTLATRKYRRHEWITRAGELVRPECGARLLQYAFDCGLPPVPQLTTAAAGQGNLAALICALSNGCGWRTDYDCACSHAAKNGHLEVLRYALREGAPFAKCDYWAALCGRRAVLEGLREDGVSFDAETCSGAASHGDIALLKWLRDVGTPWDYRTTSCAADRGHFELFKWAVERGAPMDNRVAFFSAEHGRLDILKMALERGAEWPAWAAPAAAREDHLDVLQYVHGEGLTLDPEECWRASPRDSDTRRWLRATYNIEIDSDAEAFSDDSEEDEAVAAESSDDEEDADDE